MRLISGRGGVAFQDIAEHRFRPDIEGLRAIAVVVVVLFHAAVPGFGGGFIGVDVFFVVSGFLITGLIAREVVTTGGFRFARFYARRARRLLPASMTVIVTTVVVSAFALPRLRVPDVARDGVASLFYASNFRFATQATDYFQSELDPSPLLHFWSLSLEEQFYFVWPLALAALLGVTALRKRWRTIYLALASLTVMSFAFGFWLTGRSAPWAYFSLPTRAWQLAIGGMLALLVVRNWVPKSSVSVASSATGLVLIGVSVIAISGSDPYPGWVATVPTIGTVLLIIGGSAAAPNPITRTLGLALPRFIGKISYSMYLWHWPLLVLVPAALGAELNLLQRVVVGFLSVPLAWATYAVVENPLRRGVLIGRQPWKNGVTAAGASLVTLGILVVVTQSVALPTATAAPTTTGPRSTTPSASDVPTTTQPFDITLLQPPLTEARDDLPLVYGAGCHADVPVTDTDDEACVFGDPASETLIVLIGDSHAAQWFPAAMELAADERVRVLSLTKSACPLVDAPVWLSTLKREYTECAEWNAWVRTVIDYRRPAVVVATSAVSTRILVDGDWVTSAQKPTAWEEAVGRYIRDLSQAHPTLVLGDTPRTASDPAECLSENLDDPDNCATPASEALSTKATALWRSVAVSTGSHFADPSAWVCPRDPCPVVIGNTLVYRDTHHITTHMSRSLAHYLAEALELAFRAN